MGRESVKEFLQKCIAYANESLERKRERGDSENLIQSWEIYRDFTIHAMEEIESGELDHWFEATPSTADLQRLDILKMNHEERSTWLAGIISPRPVVLISSRNNEGRENIAPYSSITIVSNTPPLLAVSMSEDSTGKPRDTTMNLQENPQCEIQLLSATKNAAKDIEITAKPTPKSEWNLLESDGPIHPLTEALLECKFIEFLKLPQEAVAKLAILEISAIHVKNLDKPSHGLDILCQHGLNRLTPGPQDWTHLIKRNQT